MSDDRAKLEEIAVAWGEELEQREIDDIFSKKNEFRAWVKEAGATPGVALRIGQALVLDEGSVVAAKALGRALSDSIPAELQGSLGGVEQRARRFRVVCHWLSDALSEGRTDVILAAASPRLFRSGAAADTLASLEGEPLDREKQGNSLSQPSSPTKLTVGFAAPDEADAAFTNWGASPQHAPYAQAFSARLLQLFTSVKQSFDRVSTHIAKSNSELHGSLAALAEAANDLASQQPRESLLWWGQARYSTSTRQPYRRITDPALRIVLVAHEAATVGHSLPLEPAASFVVETLRSMGVDPSAQRSLAEWMRDTYGAIVALPDDQRPAVGKELAAAIETAPAGLAAAWCAVQSKRNAGFDAVKDSEKLGLDLDAKIDCGDWSSWLYREYVLSALLEE